MTSPTCPPGKTPSIPPDSATGPGIGVVFSSGFFGFFAHAGFLAAVRRLGIAPAAYAGSSSGAIVAAMAASGVTDEAIRQVLYGLRRRDFWDPDPWHHIIRRSLRLLKGYSGYLRGGGLSRLLRFLPATSIEACRSPLAISATNLTLKRETVFTQGDLIPALRASCAVPMLFKPVEIDGALYVDGGIVNKAPLRAVSELAPLGRILVHFIESANVEEKENGFLNRRFTPWHVHRLAMDIARREAYRRQVEGVKSRGIDVIEVKTRHVPVRPDRLFQGPASYEAARDSALESLKAKGF
jgi:NTE family protein